MIDLTKSIKYIENGTFQKEFPDSVYLYAVGGFAIQERDGDSYRYFYLIENRITLDDIANELNKGLGLSGMLTYLNQGNHKLTTLGKVCKELGHDWGHHWMTISLLINGGKNAKQIETSFLRSGKFYESWSINKDTGIFGMSGSIKNFKKFISHKDDNTFDEPTRKMMALIDTKYSKLW